MIGENAFRVTGLGCIQVHQCKCINAKRHCVVHELGPKQDLKLYKNYYDGIIRLS